jgi:pimeloyl-ACP methyl ester carboxylesterase/uncharacterized damage-inducible protein DinB
LAIFVLVHGAMHGGWCWRDVRQRLTARGHEVYAPTLTGQGDRRPGLTPQVGIQTHVADLTELLWFEDLRDVHLVLHSYAGVLAGPVAERAAGRLASVTYLAAFIVRPGQRVLDVEPPEVGRRYRELSAAGGEGWFIPASPPFLDQWGITDPALRARVAPRLTDFPLRCVTDPVWFGAGALNRVRQTYINHTNPPLASLTASFDLAVAAGWDTYELPFGHDLMLAAPDETAALLEAIARLSGRPGPAAGTTLAAMTDTWTAPPVQRAEPGPGLGERQALEAWLDYHRDTLLHKCAGLTAGQLKERAVPPSRLSLLGLVRHMTEVERWWFRMHAAGADLPFPYDPDQTGQDFEALDGADAAANIEAFRQEIAQARAAVAARPLDDVVPSRGDHPERARDIRWIYLHMIEEYARHNGHADLLRERIDGATGD